jgi:hypothetical protein
MGRVARDDSLDDSLGVGRRRLGRGAEPDPPRQYASPLNSGLFVTQSRYR